MGCPTNAAVVRSSLATRALRRGQPCVAAVRPAADPLISPRDGVQTSGATPPLSLARVKSDRLPGEGVRVRAPRVPELERSTNGKFKWLISKVADIIRELS